MRYKYFKFFCLGCGGMSPNYKSKKELKTVAKTHKRNCAATNPEIKVKGIKPYNTTEFSIETL